MNTLHPRLISEAVLRCRRASSPAWRTSVGPALEIIGTVRGRCDAAASRNLRRVFCEDADADIVGDNTDSEDGGIGALLTAEHPFHVEPILSSLDVIFGVFAPLTVPDQHVGGIAPAVAGITR